MHETVAIHTAARRYLAERHAHWVARYAEIGGGRSVAYRDEDRDTFPRYQVAAAMLEGVERLRAEELPSLAAARERITTAALQTQTAHTAPGGEIARKAMDEERAAFAFFLRRLTPAELAAVEPLPYRRVIAGDEEAQIWEVLRSEWGVAGFWYPLAETIRPDVIAFQAPYFDRSVGARGVRRILAGRGIRRVWEMREYGPSYELDLELLKPEYTGAEGFWCSPQPDNPGPGWVLYASHEGSLSLGGEWLIGAIKALWPDWEEYLWTSPFF
jgi:hypothetical protein